MTTKKQAPKPARSIVQIRKELQPDDCTNARVLLRMFKRICDNNPDAVKQAMGKWAKERADLGGTNMVQFYADMAEYLVELFDYR